MIILIINTNHDQPTIGTVIALHSAVGKTAHLLWPRLEAIQLLMS